MNSYRSLFQLLHSLRGSVQTFLFLAILSLVFFSPGIGQAEDVTWIYPENGNWNSPANWSSNSVPTATDNVSINVAGSYTVTIDSTIHAASITIGGGDGTQAILIDNGTINGDVTNHGRITVRRTSTFNGMFENSETGRIEIQGIYGNNSNLIATTGLVNRGVIELTNNNRTYTAKLSMTNGSSLVNRGTVRSLYGIDGGGRYLVGLIDNQGTIDVTNHNLTINDDSSLSNDGSIVVGEGKIFSVENSIFHPGTGTVSGVVQIPSTGQLGSGTLSGEGTVLISGGTITGDVVNQAKIVTEKTTIINGSLINQSEGILTVRGIYYNNGVLTSSTELVNYGVIELTNRDWTYAATLNLTNGSSLVNKGTVRSLFGKNGGNRHIIGLIDNQGVIDATDYNLTINNDSSLTNNGSVIVGEGKSFSVENSVFHPGTGTVSGVVQILSTGELGSGTLFGDGTVLISGGTITGEVVNQAKIVTEKTTIINGSLTNQSEGTLTVRGIYYHNGVLTSSTNLMNYGVIELTNRDWTYAATLSMTNGSSLVNHGTVRSLYGKNGGNRHIIGLIDNQGVIDATGYNLTINNDSSLTNNGSVIVGEGKSFSVENSVFHPGTGTVSGVVQVLSTGELGSGTLSGDGTVLVSGGTITGEVVNQAKLVTEQTTSISGSLTNQSEGTLTVRGIYYNNGVLTSSTDLVNYGVIELTNKDWTYAATLNMTNESSLVNHGTVRSLYGKNGGSRSFSGILENNGRIQVDHNLVLNVDNLTQINNGEILVNESLTISQSGENPSFVNKGTITVAAGKQVAANGGQFILDQGTINGTVSLDESSILASGAISENGVIVLDNSTVNGDVINHGNLVVRRSCTFNGVFENSATGRIEIQGIHRYNAVMISTTGFVNRGVVDLTNNYYYNTATLSIANGKTLLNRGTIRSLYGHSGGNRYVYGIIENQGTFDATNHNITISENASLTNNGAVIVGLGKSFSFENSIFHPGTGTISGIVQIQSTGQLASGTLSGEGTVLISGGAITGEVVNQAKLITERTTTISGSLINQSEGTLTVRGIYGAHGELTSYTDLVNYGIIELTNNYSSYTATLNIANGKTLINHGTIRSLYGQSGGDRYFSGQLDNHGTLQVDHILSLNKPSAIYQNSGIVIIPLNKKLIITSNGHLKNQPTGILQGTGTLNIADAQLTNSGHIRPGNPSGTLSIIGRYTQASSGSLDMEIGGSTSDRLAVNGFASLNGILNISLAEDYAPKLGDSFQIMNYTSFGGNFPAVRPIMINNQLDWQVSYSPTGIKLEVVHGSDGLRLFVIDGPDPLKLFEELTYTVMVVNNSQETMTNVQVTDLLPDTLLFSSVDSTQGSCREISGRVYCSLGELLPMATATMTIKGTPTFVTTLVNNVSVTSDTSESNSSNNSLATYTTVHRLSPGDDISNSPLELAVTELSTNLHVNSGIARIALSGIGFNQQTTIALIGEDGTVYQTLDVAVDSQVRLEAMFDMGLVPVGRYDIQVTNALGSHTRENAFEVVLPQPKIDTRLILPTTFPRHGVATIYIEYENTGTVSMPAPLLRLMSDDDNDSDKPILTLDSSRLIQNFRSPNMPTGTAHSVQFIADGHGDSPGMLEPGEKGWVPVYYIGLLGPWDFSDTKVELEVLIIKGDNPTIYGWDYYKDQMKPDSLNQAAWDQIYTNFSQGVGQTWGDYISTLSENAAFLYAHGGKRIADQQRLMQFEMLQAMGHSPVSALAGGADLSVDAPGMPIVFARTYRNSMIGRYLAGPIGRGWTHNWQLSVQEDEKGNVVLTAMNNRLTFTRDSRGGYFSPVGDFSTLSKNGDIFTLTTKGGVKLVFHPDGRLNYLEDLNANRITAQYSDTLLTRLSHSSGQFLDLHYSDGLLSSISDHTGKLQADYGYADGLLASVQDLHGKVTDYTYATGGPGSGALSTTGYPDGTTDHFFYDDQGRLSEYRYNTNPSITLEYGPQGTVLITETGTGATHTYFYDHTGSFVEYQDPFGKRTRATYDDNYNLTGLFQPDGAGTLFGYDRKGNTIRIEDPLEQVTSLGYGSNSRLISLTDARSNTLRYQYDPAGNNTARISPDLSAQSYSYNPEGDLTGKRNRRGAPISIERDSDGRVTRLTYADNTFTGYSYDNTGKLLSVEDSTGLTTLDYDADHHLRRITYPGSRFLEYEYDPAGRRTSLTDQTGYQLHYSYTPDGQLEQIFDGEGKALVHYGYDPTGKLISRTLGNGVATSYLYDLSGRLTDLVTTAADGGEISRYQYQYDVNGRRTNAAGRDGVWSYTYDATGQLTAAAFASDHPEIPSKTIEYQYDKVGNRIQEIVNGSSVSYTTNNLNQYSRAGNFSYSYDEDGNLYGKTDGHDSWTYEYDDSNRLIRSTGPEGIKEYRYNGLGYLAAIVENGVERIYTIDPVGFGNVVGEYDSSGELVTRFTHGFGLVAAGENFFTFDGNGNTNEITGPANEILNYYVYEPFGQSLHEVETVTNDFEFVGQFGVREMDDDLIYMRNRFYAPSTGRFVNEDPIGLAGGDVSFYRYVQNDPVNWVDPEGLKVSIVGIGSPGLLSPGLHPVFQPGTPENQGIVDSTLGLKDWLKDHYNPDNYVAQAWDYLFGDDALGDADGWDEEDVKSNEARKKWYDVFADDPTYLDLMPPPDPDQCDDEPDCEQQVQQDEEICRNLKDPAVRARCFSSANDRYGACKAGRPLPPLVTW